MGWELRGAAKINFRGKEERGGGEGEWCKHIKISEAFLPS